MHFHSLALFLISSTFWHDLWQQTPTRVIAIATFVSGVTQLVKKAAPNAIQGKWALAVNLILSIAAVFAGMNPANFWSQTTLSQLVVIIIASGGIHGIAQAFRGSQPATMTPPPAIPINGQSAQQVAAKIAPLLFFAAIATMSLALYGCAVKQPVTAPAPLPAGAVDKVDADANRTLQTIHAFMANTTADAQAGKIHLTPAQLQAIDKVNMTLNTADVAEQAYHAAGGATDPTTLKNSVAAAQTAFQGAQSALASSTPK